MGSIKFLLAADLHLGAGVAAPDGAVAGLAAGARQMALERLADAAGEHQVSAVLLAGDVFDSPHPPVAAQLDWDSFCRKVTAGGARVLVTPGNHDPWQPGSFWADWAGLEGVHVFGPEPSGLELAGVWIAGAAHDGPHVETDLAAALPPPPKGLAGVGLVHADVSGSGLSSKHRPYAPTSLAMLRQSAMTLWCLGHWHGPARLAQHPPIIMAGALQGAHLDETGPHGAWLIELDGGSVRAQLLPLAPLSFFDFLWDDLASMQDAAALARRVKAELERQGYGPGQAACLRLSLSGASPLWQELAGPGAEETAAALKDALGLGGLVLRTSGLLPPVDVDLLASQPHLLGRLLDMIAGLRADDAALAQLDADLSARLHPILRGLPPEERRALLGELLARAANLAVGDLWRGGEGGDAA